MAETIASKLRKVQTTNNFIQRAREQFAPVAYRAANLYFAVTDLHRINSMYHFSLSWFQEVFMHSLAMCNILTEKDEVVVEDEEFKLLNMKFTVDERIELLIKTFTQELIKKIIFAVY